MSDFIIAVAGNPNSGKTTLFNALTGSRQRVGNWPGVTVEKKSGSVNFEGTDLEIVDLPGIYSLTSHSEDERVSRDYLLGDEADLVVNVVDASNLERNLFLTLNLVEMKVPLVVVLNMVDLAAKKGLHLDAQALSKTLGVPVVALSAVKKTDIEGFKAQLPGLAKNAKASTAVIPYPQEIESLVHQWEGPLKPLGEKLGTQTRWLALKLLEQDENIAGLLRPGDSLTRDSVWKTAADLEESLGDPPDSLIAEAKYGFISTLAARCRTHSKSMNSFGEALDKVVLNRFLGIPVFLGVMYLLFWTVINVGGAFIDFFDIAFGAVFVDGFTMVLEDWSAPGWLIAVLAGGIGGGIQTVATFVPIIFFMFFLLSILENSGYMARAAFVMDRFLRAIGLPGKAFIPLIVGFGCTVPAVMGTRTLENPKDRFVTVFMAPFMSCGARLPVYALFGAAFFGENAGLMVFSLYIIGILLAVLTGLLLKSTVFKGEPAPFVMELPPYHPPRIFELFSYAWQRLSLFVIRGGKLIIPAVAVLALLNTLGTDGSIGNDDTDSSVLAAVSRSITPVFTPMGVEQENWPATVGLFTGLFAKEAVVGTLNGLYGQLESLKTGETENAGDPLSQGGDGTDPAPDFDLGASLQEALASIPTAFEGLWESLADPLGLGIIGTEEGALAEEVGADAGLFATMRAYFGNSPERAYAYLLFVLIYFPCVAALGAILREIGPFFGWLSVTYLTLLAWISSTLYYQIAAGHQALWISVALGLLALLVGAFALVIKAPKETAQLG